MRPRLTALPAALLTSLAAALTPGSNAQAQCENPTWLPGEGVPGIRGLSEWYASLDGTVNAAVMWDPDGAGPMQPGLVVAGVFSYAGTIRANHIAMWNGSTWSTFGDGIGLYEAGSVSDQVYALAVAPNGHLIVGGYFMEASGVPANNVVEWTGSGWAALGGGTDGTVTALTVRSNGHIIAAGQFTQVDGTTAVNAVARWDGTAWASIGQGVLAGGDPGYVDTLSQLPNSDIIVGGYFDQAGEANASNIARLHFETDGTTSSWFAMGTGIDSEVWASHVMPNGDVIAGGAFTTAGGVAASNIARWNGSAWSSLGSGTNQVVQGLTHMANGDAVAVGGFSQAGGLPAIGIARWNGTAWSQITGLDAFGGNVVATLTMPDGTLVAGGGLRGGVAGWNGTTWSHFGTGFDHHPADMGVLANGDLLVTGAFSSAPGAMVRHVARFNGTAWSSLGAGPGYAPSTFLELPNNDIITAGAQVPAGGGAAVRLVSRWDGAAWSIMTTGFHVFDLAKLPNGEIIAAGNLAGTRGVFRWDGSSWVIIGGPIILSVSPTFGAPTALLVLPNGDIIAGGSFDLAGGVTAYNVARWDGSTWNSMGFGLGNPYPTLYENVTCLTALPNGDIVAAGNFASSLGDPTSFNNIARWDGTGWNAMGTGRDGLVVFDVDSLPDGQVVAAGSIEGSLAIWDGITWKTPTPTVNGTVFCLATLPSGNIAVGGSFTLAGDESSAHLAIYGCSTPTCPSDFNHDGFVTGDDFDGYVAAFELGDIAADFNHDGFVTGDDFDAYVLAFEAGC